MATNNLEVKFKVETSDLRKGSSDAKRTVKDTADQMARDVNGAAQNMSSSMGRVNDATKQIADAANTASNGVRNLEQNVAQSASSMERNLSRVSRQMSAMQMFTMGARGVRMVGGIAENIAKLNGATAAAEGINTVTNVGSSALQGAATGWVMTGGNPIGAAVGGLVGAGNALLEAAVKQKEAAEKQIEAAKASTERSKQTIESIDEDYRTRRRTQMIADLAGRERGYGRQTAGKLDIDFAQQEIDHAKARLAEAERNQAIIQDMIYGRNGQATTIADWSKIVKGLKFKIGGQEYDLSKYDLNTDLGVVDWMSSGKEDAIAKFFADVLRNEEHMSWNTDAWRFGAAGLPPPVMPEQLKPVDFDEQLIAQIASKITKALEDQAVEAANAVLEAQRVLSEFEPLQNRINKERAADEARLNAPLNFNEDDWPEYYGGDPTKEPRYWIEPVDKEAVAAGAKRLKDLTAMLNGIVGGAGFSSPTDALTRIGGGRGYASYNDSAARVQRNIEANLRTLIRNQTTQNNEILRAIENINVSEPDIAWQQTE